MPIKFSFKRFAPLYALALFALVVTVALAHPLGNFTINHYERLELGTNQIRVRYVMDYAEIPTFQEKQSMNADAQGHVADAARAAYLNAHIPQLISNLKLTVNHQVVPLQLEPNTAQLEFLPGQGGLDIMHISMWLDAPFTLANGTAIGFSDNNYTERLGWREIVVPNTTAATIQNSNVPAQDTSKELTSYPADLLSNPRNDRDATFTVMPGAGSSAPVVANPITTGALGAFDRTRDDFANLLISNQDLSPIVLLVSFLAAIVLGAIHAFSPGHGKAVVGAYLVGSRGNWQHAVFLGLVVTITHTAGVYALGLVTLFLSAYILPEQLFPWLGFISGMLVALIGVRLFVQRLRAARSQTTSYDTAMQNVHVHDNGHSHAHADGTTHAHAVALETAHPHEHSHDDDHAHEHEHELEHEHLDELAHAHADAEGHVHSHDNGHVHDHDHDHAHDHAHEHNGSHVHTHADGASHTHSHDFATPEEEQAHAREHLAEIQTLEKPSWRNLLSLGISGGLLPCPSALVVMLSAIALGRVLYGFYLIVGFSLGLAGVLVLTGLALLYAGRYAGKFFGGQRVGTFMRYVPIVGAFLVTLLGIGIAFDAVFQTGLVR